MYILACIGSHSLKKHSRDRSFQTLKTLRKSYRRRDYKRGFRLVVVPVCTPESKT